jgi:hypothetical protein
MNFLLVNDVYKKYFAARLEPVPITLFRRETLLFRAKIVINEEKYREYFDEFRIICSRKSKVAAEYGVVRTGS